MKFVGTALKAFYAALVAALSGLVTVLVGDTTFENLTAGQWAVIALASVTAFGGTYGLTNKK